MARFIAIAACCALLGCGSPPEAERATWCNDTIQLLLDASLDDIPHGMEAAEAALQTWEETGLVPAVDVSISSGNVAEEFDEQNVMTVGALTDPRMDGDMAETISRIDRESGVIQEADIVVNERKDIGLMTFDPSTGNVTSSTYGCDAMALFMHEFGHFFGLPHSPNAEATMSVGGGYRLSSRDLDVTDVDALVAANAPCP